VPFARAFGPAEVELQARVDAAGGPGYAAFLGGGEGSLGEKGESKEEGGGGVHGVCSVILMVVIGFVYGVYSLAVIVFMCCI
jgi:hypothetical protein